MFNINYVINLYSSRSHFIYSESPSACWVGGSQSLLGFPLYEVIDEYWVYGYPNRQGLDPWATCFHFHIGFLPTQWPCTKWSHLSASQSWCHGEVAEMLLCTFPSDLIQQSHPPIPHLSKALPLTEPLASRLNSCPKGNNISQTVSFSLAPLSFTSMPPLQQPNPAILNSL